MSKLGNLMKKFLRYYLIGASLLVLLYLGTGAKLRASGSESREQLQQRVQQLRKELKDVMIALDNVERVSGVSVASTETSEANATAQAVVEKDYKVSLENQVSGLDPNTHAVRLVASTAASGSSGAVWKEYANISRVTHRGHGQNKFKPVSPSTKRLTLEVVKREEGVRKFTDTSPVLASCYYKGLDVQSVDPATIGPVISVTIDGSPDALRCTVTAD